MIARRLLFGLMLFSTLPLLSMRPVPQLNPTFLLVARGVSGDIAGLYVKEQEDLISVQLDGATTSAYTIISPTNPLPRPLKDLAIQVWVLRMDGTTLGQTDRGNAGICNAGACTDSMEFSFEHAAPKELAGVVVRVDGKLFVREIKSNQ
jgi:hypothetical protein